MSIKVFTRLSVSYSYYELADGRSVEMINANAAHPGLVFTIGVDEIITKYKSKFVTDSGVLWKFIKAEINENNKQLADDSGYVK